MSMVEETEQDTPEAKPWTPRVIRGGKGPPEAPADNWLEKLPIRSVFACRANVNTVDWEMYFLVHKYTNIYLMKMETPDGKVWERRVDPKMFCKHYRDYELIAVYPELTEEAQQEPKEVNNDPDSDRAD